MLKLKVLTAMLLFFPAISWGLSCEQLKSQYASQDKHIALLYVRGIGDDSAHRASYRELEKVGRLLQKQILLDFMRQKKCQFPALPSFNYGASALECMDAGDSSHPDCDMSKWKSLGE